MRQLGSCGLQLPPIHSSSRSWGRSSMLEGTTGSRRGNLGETDWPRLVSKSLRRTWSGRFPWLRRILLALILVSGFISSAQGKVGAAQAHTGADKVPVAARGDQVRASGLSSQGYWLVG